MTNVYVNQTMANPSLFIPEGPTAKVIIILTDVKLTDGIASSV